MSPDAQSRSATSPALMAQVGAPPPSATPPGGAPSGTIPAVVAASRAVYAAIDAVDASIAARLGVHRSDLRCLNLLEHGPRTPSEIGAALGLTSGAVTALLDRLERTGYARRTRAAADRRSVMVELPPDAHARVGRLYGTVARAISAAFADLPDDDVAATTRGLARFAAGCHTGVAHIAADTHVETGSPADAPP